MISVVGFAHTLGYIIIFAKIYEFSESVLHTLVTVQNNFRIIFLFQSFLQCIYGKPGINEITINLCNYCPVIQIYDRTVISEFTIWLAHICKISTQYLIYAVDYKIMV